MEILYPILILGGLGILAGVGLGIASKVFAVAVDPKVPKIREALPSANCGGCGYAGCDAFAKAVAAGEAPINGCPVGGSDTTKALADIMGLSAEEGEAMVAYVKCNGDCEVAKEKYIYEGITDCIEASHIPGGGSKACHYGCLGLGTCENICPFDAIHVINGIAVVDEEACTSCGKCIEVCPRAIIELVPKSKKVRVACNSKDKGKDVKQACSVGCIGCRLCTKACEYDAITVKDNIAHVDYDKCTQCGACVEKCPTKAIVK